MDIDRFWALIEAARARAADPSDAEAVAAEASALLATYPPEEIVAAYQVFWEIMAGSYRNPLWAAAYLINGGCSDDGFDYFRGWLVAQGREVHDRVVADPDSLADVPAVIAAAGEGDEVEGEDVLGIAWNAHVKATGAELPPDSGTISYPDLDPDWGFDFDDQAEMARRLPRLAALHEG
ncbi:DUF4240 domain-containing protein [Umezawaea endophytica]|uniref:DUF4240 domain-containing protein n=1 Tax=Umezawaea endophytica TaxID=1654476 RepID=A0A9X2VS96_9PSEU|nr:DUF4240 domain-containing protein [Umezawaea endophytica]MCS7481960.1 DUF4240 domain-containing protein [Umezawaea endophytica]